MAKPTEKINKGNFKVTEKRILIMLRVKTSMSRKEARLFLAVPRTTGSHRPIRWPWWVRGLSGSLKGVLRPT